MTTIAINGFGRIGRLVFRALVEQGHLGTTFNVVAVGDIVPADNLAYLLKYDSTQGKFDGTVSSKKSKPELEEDDVLVVRGGPAGLTAEERLPRSSARAVSAVVARLES